MECSQCGQWFEPDSDDEPVCPECQESARRFEDELSGFFWDFGTMYD